VDGCVCNSTGNAQRKGLDGLLNLPKLPGSGERIDGEERIIAALRRFGRMHLGSVVRSIYGNLADEVLKMTPNYAADAVDLGGLPKTKDFPDDGSFFEYKRPGKQRVLKN